MKTSKNVLNKVYILTISIVFKTILKKILVIGYV